jgi:hypothetical protein
MKTTRRRKGDVFGYALKANGKKLIDQPKVPLIGAARYEKPFWFFAPWEPAGTASCYFGLVGTRDLGSLLLPDHGYRTSHTDRWARALSVFGR